MSKCMKKKLEDVITAEFQIPLKFDRNSKVQIVPHNIQRTTFSGGPKIGFDRRCVLSVNPSQDNTPFYIILQPGDDTFSLGIRKKIILKPLSKHTFIRGKIRFRSKTFGSSEPFESVRYFARSPPTHEILENIFEVNQLDRSLTGYGKSGLNEKDIFTLELNLTLEHLLDCSEEEIILEESKAKIKNDLFNVPGKSDFCIKMGDARFLVHKKYFGAFSDVTKAMLTHADQDECDWSDMMTPESVQVLLRFIYYKEVAKIDCPDVLLRLFKFSHMYMVQDLLRICQMRLMQFNEDMYSLAVVFDFYLFVRVAEEFKDLKKHFCRILSTNSRKWDLLELKILAQQCAGGVGVDVLVKILEFKDNQLELSSTLLSEG